MCSGRNAVWARRFGGMGFGAARMAEAVMLSRESGEVIS